ncbi:2OG-Fe(II) oxygenase [Nitrospirillum sp. BR 11828]|uniref:2OG-Fe(II) oxygenase n=1 Tax=Nitrospirillum sp. BR 11828 TaxID=3104325 RepID=UPI002ACA133E|nr:2OG-Fe(II) oxygenase [Nitrospirillum sp. BR 11828]MDZ5649353.1 2OG-Fe(II) oxygenase [Nitrospirillum sp. BR 11828]
MPALSSPAAPKAPVPPSAISPTNRTDGVLNLDGLRALRPAEAPFPHLVMTGFITPAVAVTARHDFPDSPHGGLVPAPSRAVLERGGLDGFTRLLAALTAPETTQAFAETFNVDLDPNALMVTVRSRCVPKDGRIHTDSVTKRLTALLYLNEEWTAPGGRLRLLRSADDMEDMLAEVLPLDGTLVAFRRTDNSFHGHKPHDGVRRYIMLNWMVDAGTARRETLRHGVTAGLKRLALGGAFTKGEM